ncbi:hypothetical protein PIB30_010047 [Stylosanthes scabra]|uniref:Uncharacterized protein n=1 Tax=Stylosanthes scabra TaxID=79078 RepID=A0ABU6W5B6_9FABA|nr:hypothetical protein [Stylosanthes scabra]
MEPPANSFSQYAINFSSDDNFSQKTVKKTVNAPAIENVKNITSLGDVTALEKEVEEPATSENQENVEGPQDDDVAPAAAIEHPPQDSAAAVAMEAPPHNVVAAAAMEVDEPRSVEEETLTAELTQNITTEDDATSVKDVEQPPIVQEQQVLQDFPLKSDPKEDDVPTDK